MGRHDEEHLRRFVAARDRGDAAAMRRWWEELLVDLHDRVDGFVAAAHRGRLDADEHETAVAMTLARIGTNLAETYRGASMGELVNACRTLAHGICIDVQRASIRERRHAGPSLDATRDTGEGDAPEPRWEADEAVRRLERAERGAEAAEFLAWALPQVIAGRRRVLELTFAGATLPEIAAELAISDENAYQRRSRGLKDLRHLKERYDA